MEIKDVALAQVAFAAECQTLSLEVSRRNHLNMGLGVSDEKRRLQHDLWRLRDSLHYRAASIMWHVGALHGTRDAVHRRFSEDRVASLEAFPDGDPGPIFAHARRQFFLLDDVIVGTFSLFDYLANLIGVTRLGDTNLLWSGVVRMCKKHPRRLHERVTGAILDLDARWLDKLERFRGALIHNQSQTGGAEGTLDLDSLTMTWRVWIPEKLKPRMPEVGLPADNVEVEDAAAAIARTAFTSGRTVVLALWETAPWTKPSWK